MDTRSVSIIIIAGLCAVACKSELQSDNPDVAASYQDNKYEDDIVTAQKRHSYEDQGKAIKPKTLQSIEHTITNVYEKDFERCLEEQMDEQGTRFMRAVFTVEFRIDTNGEAGDAKILEIQTRKQNAKGSDIGEVSSDSMKECIASSIDEWEFEPAPEVDYVHTYAGQVGEAF